MQQASGSRVRRATIVAVAAGLIGAALLSPAAAAQKKLPTQPLDLNSATAEQLAQLPGVGASTARAIIRFREKSGPFQRIEDLLAIRGISRKRLDKLRPYVTIRAPAGTSHFIERNHECPSLA